MSEAPRPAYDWTENDGARPDDGPQREHANVARELRLRPEPARVTRVSRKALAVLGSFAAIGLGGAFIFALEPRDRKAAIEELYATGRSTPAKGVASLPRDYSAIPKLGPPLPGEFGKPVLRQAREAGVAPQMPGQPYAGPPPSPPVVDPLVQQRRQARMAALTSGLFVSRGGATGPAALQTVEPSDLGPATSPSIPVPPAQPATTAERREAFLAGNAAGAIGVQSAPSTEQVIRAGSIIPAALVTGIRSDLPGQVIAQVTESLFDSATGRLLLIPQGSRLIGNYDSDLAAGQSRLLLAWTRLILPDGRALDLDRMPAADASGQAGLQDRTDYHWGGLLRAALISTVLGVGAQTGTSNDESDIARALRDGTSDSVSRTGRQIVDRELGRAPTITIRPGYPVRAMLTRDLDLAPYGQRP